MGDTGSAAAVSANEDPPVARVSASGAPLLAPRVPPFPAVRARITHVIFDLDGTLIDSERVVTEVSRQVVEGHGKAWTGEGAEQCVGRLPIEGARALVQLYGLPCSPEEFLQALLEQLQGRWAFFHPHDHPPSPLPLIPPLFSPPLPTLHPLFPILPPLSPSPPPTPLSTTPLLSPPYSPPALPLSLPIPRPRSPPHFPSLPTPLSHND
ncbi:unnamed protein product [Closterium sp. NIES-64]|nr:unnamed protein product [Closterium sp. NIES-64]CAI6011452.1 unnamed protein product [Closterium sp. NIES-65]